MFTLIRRPYPVVLALVAALAAATISITGSSSASGISPRAEASVVATDTATKPTVVMVHGGWADSSGWNAQVSALRKRGYPVIAPANPLRGLTSDADYVRSVLRTISGPIVLVGHSYGGAVISNAAVGVPNVEALVYIAAFAPDEGESLAQLVTKYPGTQITPDALVERPYPLPPAVGPGSTSTSRRASSGRPSQATCPARGPASCRPPSGPSRSPRSPSRRAPGVADRAVVVPARYRGPRHPSGGPGVHGDPCRRPHHPGARLPRPHAVQARGHHRADPSGRPRGGVTSRLFPGPTHMAGEQPPGHHPSATRPPVSNGATTSAAGPMNGYDKRPPPGGPAKRRPNASPRRTVPGTQQPD